MEQLLCEPEDRLGSQNSASVSRPDSLVIQARRSGFFNPPSHVVTGGGGGSVDGVELIKASRIFFCFSVWLGSFQSHREIKEPVMTDGKTVSLDV